MADKDTMREAVDELLEELEGETFTLKGSNVARVYTVAAMSNWTPDVEDPFAAILGNVQVEARLVAEAYMVAVMAGWRPQPGDPLAARMVELGLLKGAG
jgi:hypothetical protein